MRPSYDSLTQQIADLERRINNLEWAPRADNYVAPAGGGSGGLNTDGQENTWGGIGALASMTDGSQNTVLGWGAAPALAGGQQNTAVGVGAMRNFQGCSPAPGIVNGTRNTAVGAYSGSTASSDVDDTTAIGYNANVKSGEATAVGAGSTAAGALSVAIGSGAYAGAAGSTAIGGDSTNGRAGTNVVDEMKLGTPMTTVYAGKDLKTAPPSGYDSTPWQLGMVVAVAAAVDGSRYVEVMIAGTIVKLAVCS